MEKIKLVEAEATTVEIHVWSIIGHSTSSDDICRLFYDLSSEDISLDLRDSNHTYVLCILVNMIYTQAP